MSVPLKKYLLDTNVIFECMEPRPEPRVLGWLADVDEDRVFLSVVTVAEIRSGVEQLAPGRRRRQLEHWLEIELPERFEGRLLPVDLPVAHAWGVAIAHAQRTGVALGAVDAFFAATAEVNGLILATRNTKDFRGSGLELFDPWNDA